MEEYTINPDTYDEGVTIPGPSVMACPGWQDLTRHTLLIKVPMSGAYKINGTKVEPVGLPSMFSGQVVRHPSFAGHKLFNFRMPMYFFADEPVQMTLTSPWFHKPGYTKYAAIVPGRYDIGSWYRALSFEMSMWEEDADYIEFTEGEPIAYLTFDTNKPINLIKYSGTENLRHWIALRNGRALGTTSTIAQKVQEVQEGKMREEVLREIDQVSLKNAALTQDRWYNMRHDNCTSAHQTLLNGRENHLVYSVRQDAGNLLRGTRRTNARRRLCTTP